MELGRWRLAPRHKSTTSPAGRRLRFDAGVGTLPAPHMPIPRRWRPTLDDNLPGESDDDTATEGDAA